MKKEKKQYNLIHIPNVIKLNEEACLVSMLSAKIKVEKSVSKNKSFP